ncbi:MAG: SDR family oxidoreductase [Bacillaceae bacterium]|nr:SDR family oxidoreductase [Bacillaceae bacterium]
MKYNWTYQGKWALITGGSGGIGAATALLLAEQGINLLVHYNRSEAQAREVVAACRELGVEAWTIQADFTRDDGVKQLLNRLPCRPHYLVHNAGLAQYRLFTESQRQDWNRLLKVNVEAPLWISREILPFMIRERFGRIVNVSSIWGSRGAAMEVLYATTKGALDAFTRSLAREAGLNGITVNAVAPGAVKTEMVSEEIADEDLDEVVREIPLGRLGEPREIAGVISFLLSDQASYINGQVIHCNGGWL